MSNWLNGVRMAPDAVATLDVRVAALLVAEAAETGAAVGESGAPANGSDGEAAGWAEELQRQQSTAPGAAETAFAAATTAFATALSKPAAAKRRRAEASTGSDGEEGDEESSEDEWSEGESDEGEDGADGPAAGEENVYVVERILERRHSLYRIRWLGFGVKDDTWEPRANIAPALVRAFNAKLGYKSDDEDEEDDGEGGEEDESDSDGAGQQLPTTPPPPQRQQQQLAAADDPSDTPPGAPRGVAAFVPEADDMDDVQECTAADVDGSEPARTEDGTGREVFRLLAKQNQPQPQPPQTQKQTQTQTCEHKAPRGAKATRRLLSVGEAIEAKYGGIKSTGAWFPGTIVAVGHDGGVLEGSLTYSIDYDDGDQERGVLPRFVRPLKADGAVAGEATHTPLLLGPPAVGQAVGGAAGGAVRIAYCSMRHAMRLRPAPRGELGRKLACDGCQASIAAAAPCYSCGRCDFDYCAACGEARATPATAAERAADKRTLDEADFPDAKRLALDSPAAVPEIVD